MIETITEQIREGESVYSNFSHEFEMTENDVKSSNKYHQHAAWNFCGYVWWDEGEQLFKEEVWIHNIPRRLISSPSLKTLIEEVISEYGSE